MNIFFLTETESGCYRWRSAIPAKYLPRRGHTVQILSDNFQAYEVARRHRHLSRALPGCAKLVEWCKQRKIRVVFDTDDALDWYRAKTSTTANCRAAWACTIFCWKMPMW